MKKRNRTLIFIGVILLIAMLTGVKVYDFFEGKVIRSSLFSWKQKAVSGETLELMKKEKISALYQHFSSELSVKKRNEFLEEAAKAGIDVYLLTGDPKWALEESGPRLLREIELAVKINSTLGEKEALEGVVFDVEPYLLDEWNQDTRSDIMDEFVIRMKAAYKKAAEHHLKVVICIPYYYDDKGLSRQLEELTASCCDGIAVMNYYRDKEAEHIETEAAYAEKYGKELINIYELQPPGEHGLTARNTYYQEGIDAVIRNFKNLKKIYEGQNLSMSLHDYEALKEIDRRE